MKERCSYSAALSLLERAGKKAQLRITFCRNKPEKVKGVVDLSPNLIFFEDPNAIAFLTGGPVETKEWHGIPLTYNVTLMATLLEDLDKVAVAFGTALESIENRSEPRILNFSELATVSLGTCYDETCFRDTCEELGLGMYADDWMLTLETKESKKAPVLWIIMKAVPKDIHVTHAQFLQTYIGRFTAMMMAA